MRSSLAMLKLGWWFLLGATCLSTRGQSWSELLPTIRQKFPKAPQLSTSELATWLEQTNRTPPLLIDARAAEEYAVSHLTGAKRAESVAEVKALLPHSNPPPVVVYCSVGYRSSNLTSKLLKAGLTNVFNLEGSIFAWANEGRPVVRDGQKVRQVHPYNNQWGQLLAPEYRSYKPSPPKGADAK